MGPNFRPQRETFINIVYPGYIMKKRGQITVFIIIGIIILTVVSLLLYIQREKISGFLSEPIETIPSQYLPVRNFVEGCVANTATQAIMLLGLQGGYLNIPQWSIADPRASIPLTPDGNMRIPMWYYRDKNYVPSLQGMQNEITNYIGENLDLCIRDFVALSDRFTIDASDQIEIVTQIGDEAIIINVKLQLYAQLLEEPEARQEITTYTARVPVRLKRVHELAKEILNAENRLTYIENITIDLMAAGPGIPFSDMEFSCNKLQWRKSQVERDIKDLLFYNLPRIGFENTDYPEPTSLFARKNFILDVTDEDYSDLRAGVYYEREWPFDMTVRPSQGNLMSSSFGTGNEKYLSYLCINVYHFTYDIVYPVVITINDDDAFRGAGFTFNFAIPIMINHNKAQRENFQVNVFEGVEEDLAFCEAVREEEHMIYAIDRRSFEEQRDVNVTFTCMNTYSCDLGQTGPDAGVYRIRTRLPTFCMPGTIRLDKQGYLPVEEQVGERNRNDIYMIPLKNVPFKVMKRQSVNDDLAGEIDLAPGEAAYVFMTTKQHPEYMIYRKYNISEAVPENPETPELLRTIEVPVDEDIVYDVNIILVNEDEDLIGGYFGNWTPSLDDIQDGNQVIFRAMEKRPRPITDRSQGNMIIGLSNGTYHAALTPYIP